MATKLSEFDGGLKLIKSEVESKTAELEKSKAEWLELWMKHEQCDASDEEKKVLAEAEDKVEYIETFLEVFSPFLKEVETKVTMGKIQFEEAKIETEKLLFFMTQAKE